MRSPWSEFTFSPARRGFTLLELLVGVSVIIIIAGLAANDLSALMGRYRMNAAARDFAETVALVRNGAIAGNREFAIHLVASDPASSDGNSRANVGRWELLEKDRSMVPPTWIPVVDGVYDLTQRPNARNGISIEPWDPINGPPGQSLPNYIVFGSRGYPLNDASDFPDGVLRVVFRNKNAPFVEQRVVRVDRGGNTIIAAVE